MAKQTLIYNAKIVDRDTNEKGAVLIDGAKIKHILFSEAEIQKYLDDKKIQKFDAKNLTLLPAFIDMHAHFRDPGLTQKEDIESGCEAAAAGGFGTLVLMPNTQPVISTLEEAKQNNEKAKKTGLADVIQSVSITSRFDGKTISHLENLNAKDVPLITEDGKEVADSSVMFDAMKIAAKKKIIVSCHCEDPYFAAAARPFRQNALKFLSEKNKKAAVKELEKANQLLALAEDSATIRNILIAKQAKNHLHLCHVSTKTCLDAVREAKKEGLNITCEITPHHIGLSGEKAPNIFEIVNPPLRTEEDRLECIEALLDGTADVISTDHAPHTAEDKKNGSPGFSGLETAFAVCFSTLVKESGMSLKNLSEKMSARPAELLGLKKLGLIKEGFDADFVLADTEKVWTVKGENFFSKGKYSPFEGKNLTGKIEATFHKGKLVFDGKICLK